MLPKLVTRNFTNDRVGGIVFTRGIIPKNSVQEKVITPIWCAMKGSDRCSAEHYLRREKNRREEGVSNLAGRTSRKLMIERPDDTARKTAL